MAVSKSKSTIQPDTQQQQAIEHVAGPMLVVAGAGTGKTTVLIQRIAHLVREGHARPDEILALTYTDNAAKQMLERARNELGDAGAAGLQVCTFHAYCNELLQRRGRGFGVLVDEDLWVFLRRNIRELKLQHFVRAANVSQFLKDLKDFMRRCQDELVGPREYAEYVQRVERGELPLPRVTKSKHADELSDEEAIGRCRELAFVFETVERMLREHKLGTFGHMILQANELLAEDAALLEEERARARFILVDEFQDANFAQIKVLEKLAGPISLSAGRESPPPPDRDTAGVATRNVFAVGDPDQGIYQFRGASSEAFELFQKHFPESKVVMLSKNRRSTTPVLKCAHAVIAENPDFALRAGMNQYRRSPLISARDEGLPPNAAPRSPVEVVCVNSHFMEATDLVATVQERKKRSRCEWNDIGILYRIHGHRDQVAAELARSGIPFSIEGLDVVDTPEVRDLLACAGAAVSSGDSASLFRVAVLPQFSVDPEELRSAMKGLPRDGGGGMASILPEVRGGAEVARAVAEARAETADKNAYGSLLALERVFNLPRRAATEALLQFAAKWQKSPITESGSPAEFLEYLDHFREAGGVIALTSSAEENTVKLMTAHSAKGLEFDHVFVLRAIKQSFPANYHEPLIELPKELRNSAVAGDWDEKEAHQQEERRLFYVAMTRARDTLSLYAPFGRGKIDKTPPGFLRALLGDRGLKTWLRPQDCRQFQTDIFGEAETPSRLEEWIALPPASDLAARLSASAIQRYEICPLQFKLEREWRIPSEVSGALQYGAAMHRVLLTYYQSVQAGRPKSAAELIEQLRVDLAQAGFSDRYQLELYEKKGTDELREFLAATAAQPDVLHTEENFTIEIGSTKLAGRVDRIDRAAGDTVVITDYKTGRPRSQEDADESLQLSIYALAAREMWGYHAGRLVFHNLEGNTMISTSRSETEMDAAKLKVKEIAGKIAAGKFDAKSGKQCDWCAYRVLCPKTEKRLPELHKESAITPAN
jgi:DNA helicase-2/ATP-dependent DNA helicase PcrA